MLLSKREVQVDHAENGRIAVEKFGEHEEGYYDAVLMDMRMPEMDGLEATRHRAVSGWLPCFSLDFNRISRYNIIV